MRAMRKLVATTVVLILGFGFAVLGIWPASVSGDVGPTKVQVVNTPLPVSVQGTATIAGNVGISGTANVNVSSLPNVALVPGATVGISGTPNVNVSSLPNVALVPGATVGISGTPNVNVSSLPNVALVPGATVSVGNDASNPVPVRSVETRDPLMITSDLSLVAPCSGFTPYIIPNGKRLVVEHISAEGFVPSGQKVVRAMFSSSVGGQQFQFRDFTEPRFLGPSFDPPGMDVFVVSEQTKLYADGPFTGFDICLGPGAVGGSFKITIAGYLVPIP